MFETLAEFKPYRHGGGAYEVHKDFFTYIPLSSISLDNPRLIETPLEDFTLVKAIPLSSSHVAVMRDRVDFDWAPESSDWGQRLRKERREKIVAEILGHSEIQELSERLKTVD